MINVLSYVGMDMHAEVCFWTLLGLVRTIFDATLFNVNANLKQVWQMAMPDELSMPVQQVLRTMISGVMLVQCFTVYLYLASYIVLLYPVFLEERPNLVLPWLLLAATRKLLCELTSLALGLGTCVLLGPARPPCIKFVIVKLISIMPAFYMWMLVLSYYYALKVASAFKVFSTVHPPNNDHDYGLELAIRRRRTKSLLREDQLRSKIVASLYGERPESSETRSHPNIALSARFDNSFQESNEELKINAEIITTPMSVIGSNRISETGSYEDWYGSDIVVPRNSDRINEQFVLMMLRIGACLNKEGITSVNLEIFRSKSSNAVLTKHESHTCTTMPSDDTDTPSFVGSSKGNTASYVRDYPQIFMKKPSEIPRPSENMIIDAAAKTVHSRIESDDHGNNMKNRKRNVSITPNENIYLDMLGSKTVQQSNLKNQENPPNFSQPTAQSKERNTERKQHSTLNMSQASTKLNIDLETILASNDSLISLEDNKNRSSKNKNNLNEKEKDATSGDIKPHEKND